MDDKEKKLPERKPQRLKKFDYNTTGAYFITICTDKRQQILSRIVGVDVLGDPKNVELLPYGTLYPNELLTIEKSFLLKMGDTIAIVVGNNGQSSFDTTAIWVNISY